MGPLRAGPPYSWVPWTNHPLAPGLGVPPKKVYPWGAPPRISSRGQVPPRDVSPPISSSHRVSKSRCALRVSSFQFDQSRCSRWSTRCSPLCCTRSRLRFSSTCSRSYITCQWATNVSRRCSADVPMKSCERGLKRCRGTTRSPGNSTMKCIAVVWRVSFMAFHFFGCGSLFLIPFFFIFIEVFKGFDFLRTVLWPIHLCLCPRRARLNWAARFWVPNCSC